jgi:hypothetical protein
MMNTISQIAGQGTIDNERIVIVFGLVTLIFALAAFISCRTFVSLLVHFRLGNPSGNKVYQAFNKYHGYYWWIFGVLLLAHILMATLHTGLPVSGDPDAGIHWAILILGLVAGLNGVVVFFSCRVLPKLLAPAKSKFSLTDKVYGSFFKYHAWYWWLFILLAAAHFAVSYLHAGVWPAAA